MSESHGHDNSSAITTPQHLPHGHHHLAGSGPFSEKELTYFKQQDFAAARAVVVLMCTIFLVGVFIYTIVISAVAAYH